MYPYIRIGAQMGPVFINSYDGMYTKGWWLDWVEVGGLVIDQWLGCGRGCGEPENRSIEIKSRNACWESEWRCDSVTSPTSSSIHRHGWYTYMDTVRYTYTVRPPSIIDLTFPDPTKSKKIKLSSEKNKGKFNWTDMNLTWKFIKILETHVSLNIFGYTRTPGLRVCCLFGPRPPLPPGPPGSTTPLGYGWSQSGHLPYATHPPLDVRKFEYR